MWLQGPGEWLRTASTANDKAKQAKRRLQAGVSVSVIHNEQAVMSDEAL